jgi:hypothetical protein
MYGKKKEESDFSSLETKVYPLRVVLYGRNIYNMEGYKLYI